MRSARPLALLTALTLASVPLVASVAHAAADDTATVPVAGQTTTITWTGTIPVSASNSECTDVGAPSDGDVHTIDLAVPPTAYDAATTSAVFSITWEPSAVLNDEVLTVYGPGGQSIGSADTGNTTETFGTVNPAAGTYAVHACGYSNEAPQDYTGTLVLTSSAVTPQQTFGTGGLTASRETVTDPFRLGTEPTIAVAGDDTVYTSQIFGFSTTQSFLNRSLDGGATFSNLAVAPGAGKLDSCTGGGDSALATTPNSDDIYMIDLGGAPEVPARVSGDKGQTFASSCEANFHDGANYFTDRQWLSTDTVNNQMYYVYRDGLLSPGSGPSVGSADVGKQLYGEYIKTAPLAAGNGQAGAAQIAFTNFCQGAGGLATPCITDVSIAGNVVSDNSAASPFAGFSYLAMESDKGVGVAVLDGANRTVTEHAVPGNHSQVLFPTVAVDRAGTIYLAWSDATTYQINLVSSKDQGATWTSPVLINAAPAATAVMPWIVAGDAGRIDVGFYGSPDRNAPTFNYGPWNVYLVQSLDADQTAPHFAQQVMTDRPNHITPICLSGLGCTTDTGPAGDRNLGDFFGVALDSAGRAVISFADGDNQLGKNAGQPESAPPAFAHLVRQASGPSLFTSVGTVPPLAVPTSTVAAGTSAATLPAAGAGAVPTPGKGSGALTLTRSSTVYGDDGHLHVTLSVKDLAATSPTALPVATYLTRFVYADQVWAVGAERVAGQWRYFAGQGSPVSDGLAIKYAYYPATTAVTGSVDAATSTVSIDVPLAAIGNPAVGTELHSVTSYVLGQTVPTPPTPPSGNVTQLPVVVDSLAAYNTAVGPGPVVPESPLVAALPLLAVGVGGVVLLARRRRDGLA